MSRNTFQWIIILAFFALSLWLWNREQPALEILNGPSASGGKSAETSDSLPTGINLDVGTGHSISAVAESSISSANITHEDELSQLVQYLHNGEFEEAVDLYAAIYSKVSEAESRKYRIAILDHANTLTKEGNLQSSAELMRRYTSVFYKDLLALRLKANIHHALQQYEEETSTLVLALHEAISEEDVKHFRQALNESARTQAALLVDMGDDGGAISFYEGLIAQYPDYPPLLMGLSRTLVESGYFERARHVLTPIVDDVNYGKQANALLAAVGQRRSALYSEVAVKQVGENYSVEAVINNRYRVNLLIDTGASMTTIHPRVLQQAGLNINQPSRRVIFNTANGQVNVPVLQLQSLAVGEHAVADIEVGSISIDGLGPIDGLLGMNFLNKFKFTLNRQKQVMELNR